MSQKKLIVLAVMAAMAAPAFADSGNVTIYGLAHMSLDSMTQADGLRALKVSSNVSKLGFKGSEDLGDGLSAIWQIEQQINMDNSGAGNGLATRNTFAGLRSDSVGSLVAGRHDTPYKISTRKLDIFGDYLADNRSLMGGVGGKSVQSSFDGRPTDVVAYISPELGGFTALAAYVAGAEGQTLNTQTQGGAWSVAGLFKQEGLYASLAYEAHNFGTAPGTLNGPLSTKESAAKLGLGYKIDDLELGLAIEKTRDNLGAAFANKFGHKAFYLSGKYTMGANVLKLAYTKAGATATANTDANQATVGFEHNFSKHTAAYLNYTALKNGTAGTYTFATSGSTAGGIANARAGMNLSAFSLGMKHAF